MIKILDVYLHEKCIGELKQDLHGEISFSYSNNWLIDKDAISISCSLPLQKEPFKRNDCHAFFGGILPEENQRKLIAKILGISASNDFSMLERIGGECAGALSFYPASEKMNSNDEHYRELSHSELSKTLRELPTRPLLAGEQDVRLSLAGVQDKLAVYVENDKIFIPLGSAPSTHILKPDLDTFEGVIFNEAFCLELAKKINLSVAEAETRRVENIDYLLIKRYDRIESEKLSLKISRLHQEDFCQALGISPERKYQNEGGPSFKQCFNLIRSVSSRPVYDLDHMLNAVIFNYIIGNCDAHGKNFSILYRDQLRVAPLYDLVCTIYYNDLSRKMAMKLGGEYHIYNIKKSNFDLLADEVGLSKPEVRKRLIELSSRVLDTLDFIEIKNIVQDNVKELIKARALGMLD